MNETSIVEVAMPDLDWQPAGRFPYAYWLAPSQDSSARIGFDAIHVYTMRPLPAGAEDKRAVVYSNAQRALIFRAPRTSEADAVLGRWLPDWFDRSFAFEALTRRYDELETSPSGRTGRFLVDEAGNGRHAITATVTETERDALWKARIDTIPLGNVTFQPSVELLYSNRQSRFTGRPFSLWSDGEISYSEFFHPDQGYHGQLDLAPAASRLLSVALRQPWWREEERWKRLLMVVSYKTTVLASREMNPIGGRDVVRMERLDAVGIPALFVVANEGASWAGGDGDTWSHYELYENEAEARQVYRTWLQEMER